MLINVLFICACIRVIAANYYELLGVPRSASTHDIRKAYKKLALSLHPDKNQDDPEAQERFVKVTRAYEMLKDEGKRRQYDLHGEGEGNASARTSYRSYDYYAHQFGLYDDDPHVITLSGSDFDSTIDLSYDGGGQWFIKFYSPMCGSCHKAAPAWSKLAEELSGAVSFGAVNCEDDWTVCREKAGITAYPTYMLYPSGELLAGSRGREELRNFLLDRLEADLIQVKSKDVWKERKDTQDNWLLILTDSNYIQPEHKVISAMLRGLLGVAIIHCSSQLPCTEFRSDDSPSSDLIYLEQKHSEVTSSVVLRASAERPKSVMNEVLELLPEVMNLDHGTFQELSEQLEKGSETPLLAYFHMGPSSQLDIDIKKLTVLLPNFKIGRINCGRFFALCSGLNVARYPQFVIFKSGGAREFYHGSHTIHGVAAFAVDSSKAVNFRAFGPEEFLAGLNHGAAVLVDFYAPWCPPCLRLIPELRKASSFFSPSVVEFASVDCTVHPDLCRAHSVTSYPTTKLFNATRSPVQINSRIASTIVEFIEDTISPRVIELGEHNFYKTVAAKEPDELWLVGFFMPWCGPCQAMEPHYRKLAKMMADVSSVKIGKINCEEEVVLCRDQGVKSYPHIRLYPTGSSGLSTVMIYNGYQRDSQSLRRWLYNFIPSPIRALTPEEVDSATRSGSPWLIDFYAPWCGPCIAFEPDFISVAQKLDGKVQCGKLDCERYYMDCRRFGINAYPTIRFYSRGTGQAGYSIESQNSKVILEQVERYLKASSRHDEL